jgi:class 3 adenylate cyclase
MQTVMALAVVPELEAHGYPGPSCGIGIDYGEVVVARVGIRNRNTLVFIGEPAVRAAKLEDEAQSGEILLTPLVYRYRPHYLTPENGWDITAYPQPEAAEYYGVRGIFDI